MSKALVLAAGLYVFLAPICDKQKMETSMKGSNETRTRQKAPQIELLAIAYVLLFLFFSFTFFLFFSTFFFSYTFDIYFFLARSTQEQTTKNVSSIG